MLTFWSIFIIAVMFLQIKSMFNGTYFREIPYFCDLMKLMWVNNIFLNNCIV